MTTFSTSREVPAPVEKVFAAFREPERLARWWGPELVFGVAVVVGIFVFAETVKSVAST